MMTKTLFLLAALLTTGVAHADPSMPGMDMGGMDMGSMNMGKAANKTAADPLAGLTMDQQMALCARLESLSAQKRTLTPKMTQQLEACQTMKMGMAPKAAPQETLDR